MKNRSSQAASLLAALGTFTHWADHVQLTRVDYLVLITLHFEDRALSQVELRRAIEKFHRAPVSAPTLTKSLQRLHAKHLVKRLAGRDDRTKLVSLTPKATKQVAHFDRAATAISKMALTKIATAAALLNGMP